MDTKSIVWSEIAQVAKEQSKPLPPLSNNLPLIDSGLDSLCFAIIVARLEDKLGIDPFSAAEEIEFPSTVGEFTALYSAAHSSLKIGSED